MQASGEMPGKSWRDDGTRIKKMPFHCWSGTAMSSRITAMPIPLMFGHDFNKDSLAWMKIK